MASKIYFMQGAPGVGKTTFLMAHGLNRYVVAPDELRHVINRDVIITDRNTGESYEEAYDRSARTSSLAFNIAASIVDDRMRMGQTVIIDGVNTNRRTIGKILSIAEENRYDVCFVDMQAGLTIDTALKRNSSRGWSRAVPDVVVRNIWDSCETFNVNKNEKRITKDQLIDDMVIPIVDTDRWKNVHVIGDVQGCWNALSKAFSSTGSNGGPLDPEQLYIFTGDLLDRGPDNDKVYEWLTRHCHDENVILVMGNHDSYIRYFGEDDRQKSLPRKTRVSIEQIQNRLPSKAKTKELRKSARRVYNSFVKCFMFRRNGRVFMATHGGIDPDVVDSKMTERGLEMGFYAQSYFYYGSGEMADRGDYKIDIDALIHRKNQKRINDRIYQFHGHRNEYKVADYAYDDVWNLENAVENGGALRMATIDPLGNVSISEYKD